MSLVANLKLSIGSKNNEFVLRDVQLWETSDTSILDAGQLKRVQSYKGRFVAYVDIKKLPLWIKNQQSRELQCFTRSSTTLRYFSTKLGVKQRGIVFECIPLTEKADNQGCCSYYIFYRNENVVKVVQVDLSIKANIDLQIKQIKSTLSNPQQTDVKKLDSIVSATIDSRRNSDITKIVSENIERHEHRTSKVLKSMLSNDKKIQVRDTLSKLILAGLRLRGLSSTKSETQKLFRITLSASEFAHRKDLIQLQRGHTKAIPFEEMQETVETLLNLFTRNG